MKYKLIEDVLEKNSFDELKNIWQEGSNIPWFYNSNTIPGKDSEFIFTHHLYRDNQVSSNFYESISEIIFNVSSHTKKNKLLRVKANMYTNQGEKKYHAKHTDYKDIGEFTTAVYNFTTCNGGTVLFLNNKEILISSIENSLLIFDGNITHQGFTQTDTPNRVLLNIDFV